MITTHKYEDKIQFWIGGFATADLKQWYFVTTNLPWVDGKPAGWKDEPIKRGVGMRDILQYLKQKCDPSMVPFMWKVILKDNGAANILQQQVILESDNPKEKEAIAKNGFTLRRFACFDGFPQNIITMYTKLVNKQLNAYGIVPAEFPGKELPLKSDKDLIKEAEERKAKRKLAKKFNEMGTFFPELEL